MGINVKRVMRKIRHSYMIRFKKPSQREIFLSKARIDYPNLSYEKIEKILTRKFEDGFNRSVKDAKDIIKDKDPVRKWEELFRKKCDLLKAKRSLLDNELFKDDNTIELLVKEFGELLGVFLGIMEFGYLEESRISKDSFVKIAKEFKEHVPIEYVDYTSWSIRYLIAKYYHDFHNGDERKKLLEWMYHSLFSWKDW